MADVKKRYDWSYYSTISTLPDGISSVSRNGAVVLNNEIHVIFEVNNHYKWTGSSWEEVSTLPYNFSWGSTLVLVNNEIHALGLLTEDGKDYGKGHYAWDGQNWREVSVLPDYFKGAAAVVYNGEIHLLGGNNASSHIKFNGSSWEEVSTLPEDVPWCQAIVWGGKIHVFNSDDTKHWAFDGTSWAEVSTLPYYTGGSARIVLIDDEIHIFSGGDDWYCTHYRWDGTKWIDTSIIPYYLGTYISPAVAYNGVIYGISDNAMYSIGKLVDDNDYDWDDIESLGDLPYDFVDGCVLKYNDEIHILGSSVSGNERKHYKYDGSNFYEVSTLPYPFYKGNAVIFNGVINILGGEEGPKNWYKFNGTSWESSVELPFDLVDGMAYTVTGQDYNDLNDEQLEIVVGTDKYAGIHTSEEAWSVYGYYTIPVPVSKNSILFHNLQEHLFSGTYHYKYDGVWWLSANKNTLNGQSWDTDSALPYDFHNGAAVSINGDIHILGSDTSGNGTKHYSWNSSTLTWEEVSTLPYDFHNGAAVAYNDEIYIFGGTNNTKGFTKIGSIVKPDPPTPPTPPEPPVPDTDYDYLDKEGLKHLIDLIKSDSVSLCIASFEKDPALYKHSVGETLYFKDGFYKVTTAILEGDEIALGSNIAYASFDAGTAVYIWGFPNKDETYNAIYIVNEDGTGTEYANNLSGNAEPVVDKTYTVKFNLNDPNPDTWCTRVEGNVTEIEPGVTENEIDDFMAYYPCMLLEGIEGKRLNPDNYAQDLNGVPVDIESGSAGDVMVKFPSRGYKISKNGDEITVSITKERNKTGYTYPTYNGKSVKSIYESAYEGYVDGDILKSLSGHSVTTDKKIGEFRDSTGIPIAIEPETYVDWSSSLFGLGILSPVDSEYLSSIDNASYSCSAIEYDGYVHIFGAEHKYYSTGLDNDYTFNHHFRFNENDIEEDERGYNNIRTEFVSTIPFDDIVDEYGRCGQPDATATVVYDNKLHLFFSYRTATYHGVYDGTNWEVMQDSPPPILYAVEYNGEIHALAATELPLHNNPSKVRGLKHVKCNGTMWEDIYEFPWYIEGKNVEIGYVVPNLVVFDEKIHFIHNEQSTNNYIHNIYDGMNWSSNFILHEDPYYLGTNNGLTKLNNTLYFMPDYFNAYEYINNEWQKIYGLSLRGCEYCLCITYKDRIYLMGGLQSGSSTTETFIYGKIVEKKKVDWNSKYVNNFSTDMWHKVIFNGEIHAFRSKSSYEESKHFRWTGSDWEEASSMPFDLYDPYRVVSTDDAIHIFGIGVKADMRGGNKYYSWDGSSWNQQDDLDFYITTSTPNITIIHKDEPRAYFIGVGDPQTYQKHDWSYVKSISTLPYDFDGGCVLDLYDMHIFGGYDNAKKHYKWTDPGSGPRWEESSMLPYNFYNGCAVLLKGNFHILGSAHDASGTKHYKCAYNGSTWESVSTLPYEFHNGSAVVLNDEIHILGGGTNQTGHYKLSESTWVSVSTLPYNFYNGSAVVLNGEIHILGGENSPTSHYKWNGTNWDEVSTLPYQFYNGSAVVVKSVNSPNSISYDVQEIHILGGYDYTTNHYKWNGSSWDAVSTLPYDFESGVAFPEYDIDGYHIRILGGSGNQNKTKDYQIGRVNLDSDSCYMSSYYTSRYHRFTFIGDIKLNIKSKASDTVNYNNQLYVLESPKLYRVDTTEYEEKLEEVHDFSDEVVRLSGMFVFNNLIHFSDCEVYRSTYDGGKRYKVVSLQHLAFDGQKLIDVSSTMTSCRGNQLICNDAIYSGSEKIGHIITGSLEYSFGYNESMVDLPYDFVDGAAVIFNGELHILGSSVPGNETKHYKYNGSSWEEVSTISEKFSNGSAAVYHRIEEPEEGTKLYHDEIHIFGQRTSKYEPYEPEAYHLSWDGSGWTEYGIEWESEVNFEGSSAVNIPGGGIYGDGSWYEDQGNIWVIGGTGEKGQNELTDWTMSDQTTYANADSLPFNFTDGYIVMHNGKAHALFGNYHYKLCVDTTTSYHCWIPANKILYQETWDPDSALPYTFYNGSAISVDDEIHIFGGTDNGTKHYKWSSTTLTWEEVSRLPYDFSNGDAIIYNDEVYLIGGANNPKGFTKIGKRTKQSTTYEQLTFNVLTYLQCCAIIKYKGKNIQQVLGMGYTYNNSTPLPTGTMNTKGLNWGEGSGNQGVKLFGIENFYGNLDKYVDGICIDENSQIKVADGDFNDTGEGYTNVGQPLSSYRVFGFLKEILGITNGGFVSNGVVGGSDSTYFCDFTEITTNKVGVYGGNLNSGSLAGLTNLSLNVSPEDSQPLATARLTYFKVDED